MAPQLTVIIGRSRRGLAWWMARASSSLPVPDSPSIRTGMRAQRDAAGAGDDALHDGALVDDGVEGRGGGRQAGGEPGQLGVRAAQQVRQEVGAELERDRDGLHAVLDGRLDQLGRDAGLGEDDPDRGHGRGAGAQMKGQVLGRDAAVGEDLVGEGAGVAVDGLEVRRARQRDRVGLDLGVGAGAEPVQVGFRLGGRIVAEQLQPGEAAGGQGLGDGADADLGLFIDGAQVGAAEPADQDAMHGRAS
jgi:hypothetical protein